MFSKHCYPLDHHYNMNELRFVIGTSQLFKALINICKKQNWKIIQSKQEWITLIECVNATGVTLPLLFILRHSIWIQPGSFSKLL